MYQLTAKTVETAGDFYRMQGLSEEQISLLVSLGEQNLDSELEKLDGLLKQSELQREEIDTILHALKGLLTNMGNVQAVAYITEIRHRLFRRDEHRALLRMLNYLCQ